jgi:hypothetical protein
MLVTLEFRTAVLIESSGCLGRAVGSDMKTLQARYRVCQPNNREYAIYSELVNLKV